MSWHNRITDSNWYTNNLIRFMNKCVQPNKNIFNWDSKSPKSTFLQSRQQMLKIIACVSFRAKSNSISLHSVRNSTKSRRISNNLTDCLNSSISSMPDSPNRWRKAGSFKTRFLRDFRLPWLSWLNTGATWTFASIMWTNKQKVYQILLRTLRKPLVPIHYWITSLVRCCWQWQHVIFLDSTRWPQTRQEKTWHSGSHRCLMAS